MADIVNLLAAAAGAGGEPVGYQISRSLRFNSADSAYLSRTPAGAGNRKTWTWSAWVKKTSATSNFVFLSEYTDTNNRFYFSFNPNTSKLFCTGRNAGVTDIQAETTALYRDVSAWYHVVFVLDTTQATEANRVQIYVNGTAQAFTFSTAPSQNADIAINQATAHYIGSRNNADTFSDGYLAEVHFVDGQALTPSNFGETDATTGVWKPKAYAGTYGTNGFHLDFSDNTSATTLGYDAAGSNDWTLNNFSVTPGAGNDSLVDTPTPYGTDTGAGGQVRGNYATLNALAKGANVVLSNGNLGVTGAAVNDFDSVFATMQIPATGKWYFEFTVSAHTSTFTAPAMCLTTTLTEALQNTIPGTNADEFRFGADGSTRTGGTTTSSVTAESFSGDVMQLAVDTDTGKIWVGRNNTWGASGDPSNGTNPIVSSATFATSLFFAISTYNTQGAGDINFGQRPFAYTAPSGFKALCTQNLPDPTIVQGDDYFNTVLYTGTGSSQSITGVGFQPDWVWIKERSGVADHGLYDAVRGVQQQLESNTTTAETTESTGLTAFGSDGFTVGALAQLNTNTDTYVAWNWNAGGSNATNTDGTITSTVRANTTAGFSIVSYTGTGSAATIGHGLGAAPAMIIVKNRDQADAWQVYHQANTANPETDYLVLNTTAATADAADRWNDTAPTSTVFSIGNGVEVNTNTENYIAYCFADVEGYSKFGSYTGNGSADGTFVYCGFRPAFLLVKQSDAVRSWQIRDTARDSANAAIRRLYPDADYAEDTGDDIDILSNGFKLRSTGLSWNASGGNYIFMAFATSPFKYSLAR